MSSEAPQIMPEKPLRRNQERRIANSTASSSSSNLPASARPRLVRQRHDYLLPLHDPYGPGLSLSEFGDLVRHSLAIGLDSPPSENPEAGQVPTRRRPRSIRGRVGNWWEFILQLIRLTFFWVQMGLPSVYFQRVASLIQKSDISMAELASIQRRGTMDGLLRMIILVGGFSVPEFAKVVGVPPVQRFKKNWEAFAMRYREEWSNLNVISTLLLSALLTFLQIAEAGLHPFTRLTALLSLECAFMSLLYSVLYLAHFHSLGDVELTSWLFAAVQISTPLYWNMWLFLALPALWSAWSLIFFSTSLLSFVWTSGDRRVPALTPFTDEDKTMDFIPMSFRNFTPLWPRIILTVVFTFGLGVGLLAMKTFRTVGPNKWEPPKSRKSRNFRPGSTTSSSSLDDAPMSSR